MSKSNNKFTKYLNQFIKRLGWQGLLLILVGFILGYFLAGPKTTKSQKQEQPELTQTEEQKLWTCSMHPQIKLPEPGQCPICFMDLIPLESTSGELELNQLKLSPTAMKLAEIHTTEVKHGMAVREINLSGKVTYDETRLKKIASWIPGRIEKLYIDYTGMAIDKGEKLFDLYSPELIAAQEELIQIKKSLQNYQNTSSQKTLEQAREKLRLLGLNQNQISNVEQSLTPSETITITSSTAGIVTAKDAIEGRYVNTGTVVYKIADLRQVWINLDAYESDLQWLKVGQKVGIKVAAYPGREFQGKILFIDPILDSKTRSIKVRVAVANPNLKLKPGMFVRAMIKSSLNAKGEIITTHLSDDKSQQDLPLIVPASALLITGKRAVAYVRVPNTEEPTFEFREVELGPKAGEYYIVKSGLEAGEKVVTRGNFKIDSAMEIAAKPSMMNPEGGGTGPKGHDHAVHNMDATSTAEMYMQQQPATQDTSVTNQHFRDTLNSLYSNYFISQKALAEDNAPSAKQALLEIRRIANQSAKAEFSINKDKRDKWQELSTKLMHQTHTLGSAESIDEIRKTFEAVSKTVLEIEQIFGHSGEDNFYQMYCPMAFDNKGAIWIQTDSSVNNPYFGSSMLKCGEVRETYRPHNTENKEVLDHE